MLKKNVVFIAVIALGGLLFVYLFDRYSGRIGGSNNQGGEIDSTPWQSASGYRFQYPEGWQVWPGGESSSTAKLPLYVAKIPKDEYGVTVADEGARSFDQIQGELRETTSLSITESALQERPSVRTLTYTDSGEVFEEAVYTSGTGSVSIKARHSVDDITSHSAFVLIAKTIEADR